MACFFFFFFFVVVVQTLRFLLAQKILVKRPPSLDGGGSWWLGWGSGQSIEAIVELSKGSAQKGPQIPLQRLTHDGAQQPLLFHGEWHRHHR